MPSWRWLIVLAVGCAHEVRPSTPAAVEGALQGVVTEIVKGDHLRGVRITVTSPTLGGPREVFTDENGAYRVAHLPPGDHYRISFAYRNATASHDDVQVIADRVTPVYQKLDANRSPTPDGVPWCDSLTGPAYPTFCFP